MKGQTNLGYHGVLVQECEQLFADGEGEGEDETDKGRHFRHEQQEGETDKETNAFPSALSDDGESNKVSVLPRPTPNAARSHSRVVDSHAGETTRRA